MNSKTTLLGRGNITVVVVNANQEKEFRHLCKKNGEYAGKRDKTSFDKDNNPIYPIYYNFHLYKERIYIDWSVNSETFKDTLFMNFKDLKRNLTVGRGEQDEEK